MTISSQGDLTKGDEASIIELINAQVLKGVKTKSNQVDGTYENVKLVNANPDQPLVIDKSIVSAILFPTTNGSPSANLTTKNIDLGEASVNNLSVSIFQKPDKVDWAGKLEQLEHITIPLTNKTTVRDDYTQKEEDRMVVPANFFFTIKDEMWSLPKLASITIPEGYEEIGEKAFYQISRIKTYSLPSTLKKIDDYAFASCNLESVTLNEGLEHIGSGAFHGDKFTSINFPSSLRVVDDRAFLCVPIADIKFNAGLEYIGNSAFAMSYRLNHPVLEIPASVKYIGPWAFNFREYQDIYFYGSKAPLMPVGTSTASGDNGSGTAFPEIVHNGNNGFDPSKGASGSDDTSKGYANRENYRNRQDYMCILHFPKGLDDDNKATYTDITRVYECKPEGSTSGSYQVGKESETLTYGSFKTSKEVHYGYKDTYFGEQYIWPSIEQIDRSYVVNSNGYCWDGVTPYRPTLSDEDYKLLEYSGFKRGSGDGEYSDDELSKIAYLGTRQFTLTNADVHPSTDPDENPEYPVKVKGGNWWTICVPFNMTKAQVVKTFGEGTHVCRFSGVDRKTIDGKKQLTLRFQNDVYTHKSTKDDNGNYTTDATATVADDDVVIYAHEAYMIFPTISGEDANGLFHVKDYQLVTGSPVPTIVKANAADADAQADHTEYRFVGNYQTEFIDANETDGKATKEVAKIPQYSYMFNKKVGDAKYKFWFYTGNTLPWEANKCLVQNVAREGGKDDYDNFFGGSASSMAKVSQQSVFGDEDNNVTEIEHVSIVAGEGKDAQVIYNLNGEAVSRVNDTNALPKGIYIRSGKKFVVK